MAQIENNVVTHNGSFHAGISCLTGASATIVNNYISHNRYGIHCSGAGVELVVASNTIVDHLWNLYLGGSTATITNNILANADIGILFGGPYHPDITYLVSQYLTISYNDVWQNSQSDYYAVLGGIPDYIAGPFLPMPGAGEISADPLLGGTAEYHIQSGSPCIDAGDNTAVPQGIATDLDGNPRLVDDPDTEDTGAGNCPFADMGAYEYQEGSIECCQADIDADGNVGPIDLATLLGGWGSNPGHPADFDEDGVVGPIDLATLLGAWGPCP